MRSLPIGTERVWTRTIRRRVRQERFIKVSHHGSWRERWRPYSRYWWEQHVGPIPEGYQVFHRDGVTLNDEPDNLVLMRDDRFRLIFALQPGARRRQALRRARAVARTNRRRALVARFQLRANRWYVVLPELRAIVWKPCLTVSAARRITAAEICVFCNDNRRAIKQNMGKEYSPEDPVEYVKGETLIAESCPDGRYEGFMRLIQETRLQS